MTTQYEMEKRQKADGEERIKLFGIGLIAIAVLTYLITNPTFWGAVSKIFVPDCRLGIH